MDDNKRGEKAERLEKKDALEKGWKALRWAIKEMDKIESDDDYVAIKDLAGKSKKKHLHNKKYNKVLQNVKGLGIVAEEIEYIEPNTTTTTTKDIPIPLSESTPPTNASRRGGV